MAHIAKRIGPSFGSELHAAGLGGLPITWASDGVTYDENVLTPDQVTTLNEVVAAHDHTKPDPVNAFQDTHRTDPGAQDLFDRLHNMPPEEIDLWLARP